MKTMKLLAAMMISSTSAVYAATSAQSEGAGILTYFFIGFFCLDHCVPTGTSDDPLCRDDKGSVCWPRKRCNKEQLKETCPQNGDGSGRG